SFACHHAPLHAFGRVGAPRVVVCIVRCACVFIVHKLTKQAPSAGGELMSNRDRSQYYGGGFGGEDEQQGSDKHARWTGKRTLTEMIFRWDEGPIAGDPDAVFQRATQGAGAQVPYRAEMERRYGADFGGVQAYLGRSQEAQALGARAATRAE